MYCCKDLDSLSVLSLYEGELIGVVNKLFFSKNLKKLLEIEIIAEDGNKYTLLTKNIYHIGKNAITIKNNQAVSLKVESSSNAPCPINSKAYTINGEYLGTITELDFDDKFFTKKIILDNAEFKLVENIASSGKNTVIFSENDTINIKKFLPQKSPKSFKSVTIQNTKTMPIEQIENTAIPIKAVTIANQSSDFLLGRICTKDIYNFNNELLIKAHSVVNKKNLKEINKYGKLRELMLYSK